MRIPASELIRRSEIESAAKALAQENGKTELSPDEIRDRVLDEFTKKLDAKLKNIQDGEGLAVNFSIDIIRTNGKIRGGSGSQRNMPEYIEWRTAVFERDNYTCQSCGAKGRMNAHHIKSWSSFPELRFDINNGITLCFDCHAKEHPHIGWMQ